MRLHTHTHKDTDMSVVPPCYFISQILWAVTGSCAKIANRKRPYSSPLLLTLISLIPSFPSIVQGGTSGLVNMFTDILTALSQDSGGLDALHAWMMLRYRAELYHWILMNRFEIFQRVMDNPDLLYYPEKFQKSEHCFCGWALQIKSFRDFEDHEWNYIHLCCNGLVGVKVGSQP